MMHVHKNRFSEITIGSCKFMHLAIFCEYFCVHGYGMVWYGNCLFDKSKAR